MRENKLKIKNVKLKIDLGTQGGRVGDVKEGIPQTC